MTGHEWMQGLYGKVELGPIAYTIRSESVTDTPWTPGPWEAKHRHVDGDKPLDWWEVWSMAPGPAARYLANAHAGEGDARLIAAAPEMAELLAELQRTRAFTIHADGDGTLQRLDALLSRIRGEAETHDSVGGTHDSNTCHACR